MSSKYKHLGTAVVEKHELAFLFHAFRTGSKMKLIISFGDDGFPYHHFT